MIDVDPLMYLLEYVVPLFKVDTLQERGRESSLIELIVVQRVASNFQP